MAKWFIRAHCTASDLSDSFFIQYLADRFDVLVCVQHPPDSGCARIHCHLYVENCRVKYDSISTKLTEAGCPKGNTGRSIKDSYKDASGIEVPLNRHAITYMSKGIYNPSYLKGISMEEYNEFSSKWIEHETKEEKKKEKKEKKKTERDIYFSILNTLETQPYDCRCYNCYPCPVAPKKPIYWDATSAHQHTQYAMRIIRDEYMNHSYYDERKMMRVMYMLVNHKDIHENSVTRVEKFLYS